MMRRQRLTLRARKCASCTVTLLRGAWAWRVGEGEDLRFYCDNGRCRFIRGRQPA